MNHRCLLNRYKSELDKNPNSTFYTGLVKNTREYIDELDFNNDWDDCPEPGCENKICLSLESDKCFTHTDGNKDLKLFKIYIKNKKRKD